MNIQKHNWIWIFRGLSNYFVFSDPEKMKEYVQAASLDGTATLYPINVPIYDWAIDEGLFEVRRSQQKNPTFIIGFSSASQPHLHFKNGICDSIESVENTAQYLFSKRNKFFCVLKNSQHFPGAVYDDKDLMDAWIQKLGLSPKVVVLEEKGAGLISNQNEP